MAGGGGGEDMWKEVSCHKKWNYYTSSFTAKGRGGQDR